MPHFIFLLLYDEKRIDEPDQKLLLVDITVNFIDVDYRVIPIQFEQWGPV